MTTWPKFGPVRCCGTPLTTRSTARALVSAATPTRPPSREPPRPPRSASEQPTPMLQNQTRELHAKWLWRLTAPSGSKIEIEIERKRKRKRERVRRTFVVDPRESGPLARQHEPQDDLILNRPLHPLLVRHAMLWSGNRTCVRETRRSSHTQSEAEAGSSSGTR